ncbi:MAG TPA: hypothetical protein VKT27_16380 [Candidatus Binataceae bacterium]|nr:hypothetical protein [Candidatus Binataceae bacterium]
MNAPAAGDLERDSTVGLADALEDSARRRPLRALAVSAGTGFVLGGGLRSRVGLALALFVGRSFAGPALMSMIEAMTEQHGDRHRAY